MTPTPPPHAPKPLVDFVALDSIRGAKRNPRKHDIPLLCGLIRRFGFGSLPVLDADTGRLTAGHGRILALRAMRDAGELPPKGITCNYDSSNDKGFEWLVPVRRMRFASESEAAAYLLADNQSTASSRWDWDGLRVMLDELAASSTLLEGLGWTANDLDRLLADETPPEHEEERDPEPKTQALTITFERQAFAALLPRLAGAQARHRTPTYAATLEALLALSEAQESA